MNFDQILWTECTKDKILRDFKTKKLKITVLLKHSKVSIIAKVDYEKL
jgi:hypothetical protein